MGMQGYVLLKLTDLQHLTRVHRWKTPVGKKSLRLNENESQTPLQMSTMIAIVRVRKWAEWRQQERISMFKFMDKSKI